MLLTLTHISAAFLGAFIVLGIQALRDASRERAKRELRSELRRPLDLEPSEFSAFWWERETD